jgi:hypothetical protein
MKLAEALALRAEAARRIEQLRSRIVDNARYQEGEEPAEDASRLLARSTRLEPATAYGTDVHFRPAGSGIARASR